MEQHDLFRIFATTNTVGLGDTTGLYHGTQQINQGQMDRWNIVSTLNYLPFEKELEIVLAKNKGFNNKEGKDLLSNMIRRGLGPRLVAWHGLQRRFPFGPSLFKSLFLAWKH